MVQLGMSSVAFKLANDIRLFRMVKTKIKIKMNCEELQNNRLKLSGWAAKMANKFSVNKCKMSTSGQKYPNFTYTPSEEKLGLQWID